MFVSRSANSVAVVGSCCNFFFVALCRTLHKKREIEKVCLTCLPIINPFFYGYRLSFVYFCLYRVGTTHSPSPSLISSTYAPSMKALFSIRTLIRSALYVILANVCAVFPVAPMLHAQTWLPINASITNLNIFSFTQKAPFIFVGTGGGGIFRSSDGGTTWTAVNTGLTNLTIFALTVKGSDIFAGTVGGGVHRSSDNGLTWTPVNTGLTNLTVFALLAQGGDLFAGTQGGGIFYSNDNGATWTPSNTGLADLFMFDIVANGGFIFATTNGAGIHRSADNGATWTQVNTGVGTFGTSVVSVQGAELFLGTFGAGAYRSTDNGATWTQMAGGLPIAAGTQVWRFVAAGGNIYAGLGAGGGIYQSSDGGVSWTAFTTGLTNFDIWSFLAVGSTCYAGTLGGGVHFLLQPPVVTSFTPTSGSTGSTVSIFGSNFTSVTGVQFGGVPAMSFSVISSSQINAVVGTGTSGSVDVTSIAGTGSLGGFTFVLPPIITSFSPSTASVGNAVTITGTNLGSATSVTFGGVPALSFSIISATQIIAVVGTSSASGNVSVTNPAGTGFKSGFTFISPPPPPLPPPVVIQYFTPVAGTEGTVVSLVGYGFADAFDVRFGGVQATRFSVSGDTLITAVVGKGNSGFITVASPKGSAVSPSMFRFIPPPSTIVDEFSPTNGEFGTIVTIFGRYFTNATFVSFGGVPARSFTVDSDTQITAVVGGGATGDVVVVAPKYGTGSKGQFTYTPAGMPVITDLQPSTVRANGEDILLTMKGYNFSIRKIFLTLDGSSDVIGASALTPTQVDIKVSRIVRAGVKTITLMNPDGELASTTLTITSAPAPVITSLSVPSTTASSEAFTVMINGTGFFRTAMVSANNTPLQTLGGAQSTSFPVQILGGLNIRGGMLTLRLTNSDGQYAETTLQIKPRAAPAITTTSVAFETTDTQSLLLTIMGVNFLATPVVRLGGVVLVTKSFSPPNRIVAIIPIALHKALKAVVAADSTKPPVLEVINPDAQSAGIRWVPQEPPRLQITDISALTISFIDPQVMKVQFSVLITGRGFRNPATVVLNGVYVQVQDQTDTTITILLQYLMSNASGVYPLIITNPNGESVQALVRLGSMSSSIVTTTNAKNILAVITSENESRGLHCYPNPTEDVLTVETIFESQHSLVYLTITNVLGVSVLEYAERVGMGAWRKEFDIKPFPAGVYLLTMRAGGVQSTQKILKR